MLRADFTNQFKKDYQRAKKRGWDVVLVDDIIRELMKENLLIPKHKDHILHGGYSGYRECHIKSDWLLIYRIENGIIVFERTGTHSDLF